MKKLIAVVAVMFASYANASPCPFNPDGLCGATTGAQVVIPVLMVAPVVYEAFTHKSPATNFQDAPAYIKPGTNWVQHVTMTEYLSKK